MSRDCFKEGFISNPFILPITNLPKFNAKFQQRNNPGTTFNHSSRADRLKGLDRGAGCYLRLIWTDYIVARLWPGAERCW